MLTGTKEIKKVAEARMRKKKRAANTLKAAKKSATMMAENSEMSEKQKLKVRNFFFRFLNEVVFHILFCTLHFYFYCLSDELHLFSIAAQAVAKAMRTSKVDKPSKVYVVTHKTSSGSVGQNSGGKGKLKFVDARMKKDARSMKNLAKKGKKGKKGKGKK